ncbi:MAG: FkbM family methyltransferase [Hyphomicrobiales bacterium]|nr:FkbM family methyltransferase [Hyphomicrobiales bacterium]
MEDVVQFECAGHPFFCPRDEHTLAVVGEVLSGAAYPVPGFLTDRIRTLVDVGANLGAAAVWFHALFPHAAIECYEPTLRAFRFLARNTAPHGRIRCHHAGLLDRDGRLDISVGGTGSETSSLKRSRQAAFGVHESAEFRAALPVVEPLLETGAPLALKVDTEGCEVEILGSLAPVLDRIELLLLEYHSEEDRVAIDTLARAHGHILFAARADQCHLGTTVYVHRETAARLTDMEADAIR